MIRRLLLFCLVCSLWPSPCLKGQTVKYDACLRRWSQWYFPWEDWHWFRAQARAESGLNALAVSSCGAVGIMQLMPPTARALRVNPYDPEANIQGGIHYNRDLWGMWGAIPATPERRKFMFASYNAGPGNIQRAHMAAGSGEWAAVAARLPSVTGKHAAETVGYVARILQLYQGT